MQHPTPHRDSKPTRCKTSRSEKERMQKQRNRIEKKRFRDPPARRHRFGERGAESSSLFAVSQFVVRSPRRLHCAAGTAALRVYETRYYLLLRPFPGRGDGNEGENLSRSFGNSSTPSAKNGRWKTHGASSLRHAVNLATHSAAEPLQRRTRMASASAPPTRRGRLRRLRLGPGATTCWRRY